MKKTLALLLVASLLLAGCTELISSDDDEVKKIDVNEEKALEEIADFITIDADESFGITMMYEMDLNEMDIDSMMEEGISLPIDENSVMTYGMTQAWSPDGIHASTMQHAILDGISIKTTTSTTHVGTTIYYEIETQLQGDICEEVYDNADMITACESQIEAMPTAEYYSMETAMTHTQAIEAMAEETSSNSDDFDAMAFLEVLKFVECAGEFTPATSEDGLQMFDVTIEGMGDDTPSPEAAMCVADKDNSDSISFEEFTSVDQTSQEDLASMQEIFDEADTDGDDELTLDDLGAFIDAVDAYYEEQDGGDDDGMDEGDDPEMTQDITVAFNDEGVIEYFEMGMDGMVMKMYVLTSDTVEEFFEDLEAGELVALPFTVSDSMDDGSDDWDDDGDFYCNDGTTIPMDWVNDGDEDCVGGEDEMGMGGSDDEFTCDDGSTIPMDWVNDGEEDCMGGEDEGYVWTSTYDNCADSDHGLSSLDCWDAEWDIDGDGVPEDSNGYWNYECEQLADGSWECMTDEINYYDNCAYEDEDYYECWLDEWDTDDDGSYDLGSDGYMDSECEQLADGRWACSHSDDGGGDGMLTPELVLELFDSDGDSMLSWDEFWNSFASESADDEDALSLIFDENDDDMDGLLSTDELEDFILAVSAYEDGDEPTFICGNGEEIPFMFVNDGAEDCSDGADEQQYDSDGNEINWFDCMDGTQIWISDVNDGYPDCQDGDDEMPEMDDDDHDGDSEHEFTCNDGTTIPMSWVNDGDEDCAGGEDESTGGHEGHNHGDGSDDSSEIVMYVTSDMDFHFEGDLSDYKIELATCESDYNMETGEETTTCATVMSVAIADAGMDSDVMFHDADSSGTLSVGDMIHIGETSEEWNTVRLYSVSADAYSDENPMHDAPGFTGLVGILALLGAAFIRRNE